MTLRLPSSRLISEPGMSDPHALVVGEAVYLFTGHDVGFGVPDWVMPDWRIYRSENLLDWTHVGTIDFKGQWYHVWCAYRDREKDRNRDCYLAPVVYGPDGSMRDDLSHLETGPKPEA